MNKIIFCLVILTALILSATITPPASVLAAPQHTWVCETSTESVSWAGYYWARIPYLNQDSGGYTVLNLNGYRFRSTNGGQVIYQADTQDSYATSTGDWAYINVSTFRNNFWSGTNSNISVEICQDVASTPTPTSTPTPASTSTITPTPTDNVCLTGVGHALTLFQGSFGMGQHAVTNPTKFIVSNPWALSLSGIYEGANVFSENIDVTLNCGGTKYNASGYSTVGQYGITFPGLPNNSSCKLERAEFNLPNTAQVSLTTITTMDQCNVESGSEIPSTTITPTPTAQPMHIYAINNLGDFTVPADYVYPEYQYYQYPLDIACGEGDTNLGFYYTASGSNKWNNSAGQSDYSEFPPGNYFFNQTDDYNQDRFSALLAGIGLPVDFNKHYVTGGWPQWDRIGIKTWGENPVTISNIHSICFGSNEPEILPTTSLLCDGDMEEYFTSSCWSNADSGTITKVNGTQVPYTWDRLNTDSAVAPWPLSWSNWWANGDALCKTGYQAVGKVANINGAAWSNGAKGAGSAIEQSFQWAGGTLYWRISARGKFVRFLPPVPQGKALAYIYGGTAGGTEGRIDLLKDEALTASWQTFTGSVSLAAGTYFVRLDAWDKENFLINTLDDGVVYYDDVFFSTDPVGAACSDTTIESTPTPNPSLTPNVTTTPLNTATPTMPPGNWTPTPDGSPTPTDMPDMLNIWNCGFETSSAWLFNSQSSIGYAGGPTGPQYANAVGSWPAVYQTIVTQKSAVIYVTAWVKGSPYMRFVNIDTNQVVDIYRQDSPFIWVKISEAVNVPAGRWRLELNPSTPSNGIAAQYDGITASFGAFATSAQSWCAAEPTPGPTAYVTLTPTPTGTLANTSTPRPTATPPMWYTPLPSGTPRPSETPNQQATNFFQTATALGTPNAGNATGTAAAGTATAAQGTATAQGTPGGGAGTGTPGPTPGYGNNGIGGSNPGTGEAPCPKPGILDFGHWIDAGVCEIKAYFAFGPSNIDQIKDFRDSLNQYEPFGTLGEMTDSLSAIKSIVNSYNWGTGIQGTQSNNAFARFIQQAPNWLQGTGQLNLFGNGAAYSMNCSNNLTDYAGPRLSPGICWVFDMMAQNGLLAIMQTIIDAVCITSIFTYIDKRFVSPHS